MAIEITVLAIFDPRSSIVKSVFDCRLPGVIRDMDLSKFVQMMILG